MKINNNLKSVVMRFCISVLSLILLLTAFFYRGSHKTVEILTTPVIQTFSYKNDLLALKWTPVEYATSYRIFYKNQGGDWKHIDTVPYTKTVYKKNKSIKDLTQFAVKAYYVSNSGDKTISSKLSKPVTFRRH